MRFPSLKALLKVTGNHSVSPGIQGRRLISGSAAMEEDIVNSETAGKGMLASLNR